MDSGVAGRAARGGARRGQQNQHIECDDYLCHANHSTPSRDVVIVDGVVRQAFNLDLAEARLGQQLQRLLLAPGRAQPFAAESQRDGHAMEAGDL